MVTYLCPNLGLRKWMEGLTEIAGIDQHIFSIEVADAGQGFDLNPTVARQTSGLAGMHERATLVGGQLKIESRVGAGTRLLAELSIIRKKDTQGIKSRTAQL